MLTPAMIVPAPPVSAPRYGLLASAARPDMSFDVWRNGITFRPRRVTGLAGGGDDVDGYTWWNVGDDGEEPGAKPLGALVDMTTWYPYGVLEGDTGTAAGLTADNYRQSVIDVLTADQSRKMERELWTGVVSALAGLGNDFLANPATTTDLGTGGPTASFGALQGWLADTQNGRGMIHVPVGLVAYLDEAGLLRREGNLILDSVDNIVVPGVGYPGTAPGNEAPEPGTLWAYATPIVQVVEGTVDVLPGELSEALVRGTNQVEYRAERPVMAWWDNQNNHAGVEVILCDPCGDLTS